MKKARGKAAAKHQAAKAAAKAVANSVVEEAVVVTENTGAEVVSSGEIVIAEDNKDTKKEVKPEILVQFRQYEADMDEIIRRVKENFEVKGNHGVEIEKIQVYVKPEDFTAYYVINDGFAGKVNLF